MEASVSDGGTLRYQWYGEIPGLTNGPVKIPYATESTLDADLITEYEPITVYYYCVVTNENPNATGAKTASVTSRTATLIFSSEDDTEFTITFDATGGTVTPSIAVTKDGKLDSLPQPIRSGYTFDGWYTAADGGTEVTTETEFTQNSTIYAHWTATGPEAAEKPLITAQPKSASYTVNDTAADLTVTASVTDGGTLSYQWYSNTTNSTTEGTEIPGATGMSYKPSTAQAGTVYYYCIVTNTNNSVTGAKTATATSAIAAITVTESAPAEYTITFHANGGTVTPASARTTGGKLTSLPVPSRNGYTFAGWFTSATGGSSVTTNTVFGKDTTLYAHWTYAGSSQGGGGGTSTSTYRITLAPSTNGTVKANRTYAGSGSTVTLTVTPDSGYQLDTLTITGANGKHITCADKGNGSYTFTMPSSAVTVKAVFTAITPEKLPFVDVPAGIWYEEGVRYVYEHDLMTGTSATTFAPDMTTTRSMIATILWRLEGSPEVDYAMTFTDVASSTWYTEAVRWAASEGIITGYGNGDFGPDDPITREQMATMLYRYARYKGYDVSVGENTNILSYTDFAQLGEYAVSAMQWAVGAGIINGTGDGSTLAPLGQATRAQAAVMLQRFSEGYVTQ